MKLRMVLSLLLLKKMLLNNFMWGRKMWFIWDRLTFFVCLRFILMVSWVEFQRAHLGTIRIIRCKFSAWAFHQFIRLLVKCHLSSPDKRRERFLQISFLIMKFLFHNVNFNWSSSFRSFQRRTELHSPRSNCFTCFPIFLWFNSRALGFKSRLT